MSKTIIEKIIASHAGHDVRPGDIVDVRIDARVARDFGGANVVKNIEQAELGIADPACTYFTFDCNPGGSDQKYAANQQTCRQYARRQGIRLCDVDAGIGTHLAMELGFVGPGQTLVSTDSHANIMGAIGAFGQGMGDQDIAHAFAHGTVWFKIPPTQRIRLTGQPSKAATPKDVALALCRHFGANGLLGYAAELYGPYVDGLDVAGRVTLASMCTEMGGIILMLPPNEAVLDFCREACGRELEPVYADKDAVYAEEVEIDLSGLEPLVARPGQPEDVVPLSEVAGTKIDSAFIGSCTNGRFEDIAAAARILKGRHVAPGVVLKIVPATDGVWRRLLDEGLLRVLKEAGALVGNAGCAGCAAGQIGQNGPGEVTVSTGNRNFPGKQGKGSVYLASPETAAASAIAGVIAASDRMPAEVATFAAARAPASRPAAAAAARAVARFRPTKLRGRVWRVGRDNIDTDMIYHNRHLAVTDAREMGQYAFGNLPDWEDFPQKVQAGDIIITGRNFGCGSSRQQAVDCFQTLGVSAIIAESFGAIYERNAINAGLAIMTAGVEASGLATGDEIEVDLETGLIRRPADGMEVQGEPLSTAQMAIYQRGGLLVRVA
ncbi:MAG: aconitase/3-isopropylmalate dehydratase large subunit family protein [Phycisphaerae bacterium]|jgi:homoaconitate hydratase family protein/3-isopropylmalate dehydratase small subunit